MKTFSAFLKEEKEPAGKADVIDISYGSVKHALEQDIEDAESFTLGRFLLFASGKSGIERSTVDYFISHTKTLLDDCKKFEAKIKATKGWKEKNFPVNDGKGHLYQWKTFEFYRDQALKNIETIRMYIKNGLPLYKLLKKLKPSKTDQVMDDTTIEVFDVSGKSVYKGLVDNFEMKSARWWWLGKSLGLWVIAPERQSIGNVGKPEEFKGVYIVRAVS